MAVIYRCPWQTGGRYTEQVFTPANTYTPLYIHTEQNSYIKQWLLYTVVVIYRCPWNTGSRYTEQVFTPANTHTHTHKHTPLYIHTETVILNSGCYIQVSMEYRSSHQQTHTPLYRQNNSYIKQWSLYTVIVIYRCPWNTGGRYTEQVFTPAHTSYIKLWLLKTGVHRIQVITKQPF